MEEVDTVALDIVYEHYQVSVEHWFFYNTHCMVTIEKIVCDVLCVLIVRDEINERKHKMEIIIIFLEYLCCVKVKVEVFVVVQCCLWQPYTLWSDQVLCIVSNRLIDVFIRYVLL